MPELASVTTCSRCGHRLIRDWGGWSHHPTVPMSPAEQRRTLRHRPQPNA